MTDRPDEQQQPTRPVPGVEVARRALAAAKVEAARRGVRRASYAGSAGRDGTDHRRRATSPDETRSGAHADERDPQLLTSAVGRLVSDHGWELDAAAGAALGRWAEIVGADIAVHSTPVSVEEGNLTVVASSTAWATQLRLLAPALLGRLADELGEAAVTRLTVRGPSAPSWARGPLRVKGRGPRDTYG